MRKPIPDRRYSITFLEPHPLPPKCYFFRFWLDPVFSCIIASAG